MNGSGRKFCYPNYCRSLIRRNSQPSNVKRTNPVLKKDVSSRLASAYNPSLESTWYEWWEKEGFFSPELQSRKRDVPCFSMVLPPPNVTGSLHIGHALTNVIQDAIVRWHRMRGKNVLWVPGFDHAGIATQVVVEKLLWKTQQKTRHQLGREQFLEEVWKWKQKKEKEIQNQLRRLGSSLDWSRSVFTMDPEFSTAVTEAFVRLHEAGLIVRRKSMVKWCCHLQSTISDVEVNYVPIHGKTKLKNVPGAKKPVEVGVLTKFSYPVYDSACREEIVVATTRPETMLGDTAVAIHPNDSRYTHLHGKMVQHPFTTSLLPIVCDEFVEQNVGTGAVKLTPSLDPIDFDVAQRLNLPVKEIMDEFGIMNQCCGQFEGLSRFEAREAVSAELSKLGLIRGKESHKMMLPLCSRSEDILEFRLKSQWFIQCSSLAEQAIQAVKSNRLKIDPDNFEKVWLDWLNNSRDWCVSRQLWWGHRIPAYRLKTGKKDEHWFVGRSFEEAQQKAVNKFGVQATEFELEQDEDVLDTWFSSALFPFASMGWPKQSPTLQQFYPVSLMETGHDIMSFWVTRMVMLGTNLTGELPFHSILLHGIICDTHGRKMSKSLGNVINPMDVINGATLENLQQVLKDSFAAGLISKAELKKATEGQIKEFPEGIPICSADALRFTLCIYDLKSHFINLDVNKAKTYRLFCNKIWQAARFVLDSSAVHAPHSTYNIDEVQHLLSAADCWILSRLSTLIHTCNDAFEKHELHLATLNLYKFIYNEFCDVYLESVKPRLQNGSSQQKDVVCTVLVNCLHNALLTLSPFMPFLTEELYQHLPIKLSAKSICIAKYPELKQWSQWHNKQLENTFQVVLSIVRKARSIKQEYGFQDIPEMSITSPDEAYLKELQAFLPTLKTLTKCNSLYVAQEVDNGRNKFSCLVNDNTMLHAYFDKQNILDVEKQVAYLKGREMKLHKSLEKLSIKMKHAKYHHFLDNSKEKHTEKKAAWEDELAKVEDTIKRIRSFYDAR